WIGSLARGGGRSTRAPSRRCTAPPTGATCASASRPRVHSCRSLPVHSKDVGGTAKTAESTYDYAVIRVVPRVERGEAINVGVIVSCPDVSFLDARIELDGPRLVALHHTAKSADIPTK